MSPTESSVVVVRSFVVVRSLVVVRSSVVVVPVPTASSEPCDATTTAVRMPNSATPRMSMSVLLMVWLLVLRGSTPGSPAAGQPPAKPDQGLGQAWVRSR
jgi:hypothetical protein